MFYFSFMTNEVDKLVVEKMQAAYEEFARYMAELEGQGNDLVKDQLKEIDKGRIEAALKKIKEVSQK